LDEFGRRAHAEDAEARREEEEELSRSSPRARRGEEKAEGGMGNRKKTAPGTFWGRKFSGSELRLRALGWVSFTLSY